MKLGERSGGEGWEGRGYGVGVSKICYEALKYISQINKYIL